MTDEHNNNPGSPAGPPPELLGAISKVLRPLIKLMLSYQITYPLLIAQLKSLYVDVAEKDFQVNNKRQSDSRINLLTGVHRKDVKRLRAESPSESATPTSVSTGAQIIGEWMGSPEYLDESGRPIALPLKTVNGDTPSFEELVEKVCKQDIRPRVILDEWLRLDVARLEDDHVILNTGAFTPDKGFDEKVFFFGKNTRDHIAASAHNLLGQKPSYFDRSVYYDRLSEASIEELAELANTLGMQALTTMNKKALELQKRDQEKAGSDYRMNFGVFNFNSASNENDDTD